MKKFMTLLVLAIVASTGTIYAQYASDALRFSQTNYGSSSRFKGLGNAQTSLGGDISSLGGNPAGLGMFTRSEFALTPEFNNSQANSSYLGNTTTSSKNRLNLSQIGVAWYNPVVKANGADLNKGLVSTVFGIGYSRNNDFSSNVTFGGRNLTSSIGDFFAEQANGATFDNLGRGSIADMAYQNGLIDETIASPTAYQSAIGSGNNQYKNEVRSGSTSELNFAGALNFSNQFYLGASLNIVNVRYLSDAIFTDNGTIDSDDPANPYDGLNYNVNYRQSQQTDGTGINARLGMIFKPVPAVRIGASFQTPTWMHISDNSSEYFDVRYPANAPLADVTDFTGNYQFDYSLRTPYKGSLGASFIIGNHALISADVDYVDYASIKFSTAANNNNADARNVVMFNNMDVKDFYTSAVNYRVGGEYKIADLSLRAGFGVNGSPYKDDNANVFDTKYYSGGLGYRFSQYYVDLAYQRVETNNTYVPYTLSNQSIEPTADVKLNRNNVFLTFGVKF
ncbi:hypothetical protein LPB86_11880 [Pedobacter sp. MC2016-14]|uniref:OmpP1/FadL family transporter n=1 Tax=Pedobacter sp. MC2016-14 TaxID=2897327 RepID=UPI001E47665C|nr:hypothetical protein [Pedobacter sp. MC2016-14]MCD0488932.1 hypothetical protein [Pedobacter sp. MC2016-14]